MPFFHLLGWALAECGVTGLVLAATGADARAIDVVSRVVPGGLLLAFALWGGTRAAFAR